MVSFYFPCFNINKYPDFLKTNQGYSTQLRVLSSVLNKEYRWIEELDTEKYNFNIKNNRNEIFSGMQDHWFDVFKMSVYLKKNCKLFTISNKKINVFICQ